MVCLAYHVLCSSAVSHQHLIAKHIGTIGAYVHMKCPFDDGGLIHVMSAVLLEVQATHKPNQIYEL